MALEAYRKGKASKEVPLVRLDILNATYPKAYLKESTIFDQLGDSWA